MDELGLQQFRAEVIARRNLPTIPMVLTRILQLVDGESASGRDLIEGLTAGSAMLRRILDTGPLDANAWRARAGLPAPG